jgi:hypothetical protein
MRPGDALPHQGKSAEHYKGVGPCPGATIDDEETRVPSAPGAGVEAGPTTKKLTEKKLKTIRVM